jgi:hypothetical protein
LEKFSKDKAQYDYLFFVSDQVIERALIEAKGYLAPIK